MAGCSQEEKWQKFHETNCAFQVWAPLGWRDESCWLNWKKEHCPSSFTKLWRRPSKLWAHNPALLPSICFIFYLFAPTKFVKSFLYCVKVIVIAIMSQRERAGGWAHKGENTSLEVNIAIIFQERSCSFIPVFFHKTSIFCPHSGRLATPRVD